MQASNAHAITIDELFAMDGELERKERKQSLTHSITTPKLPEITQGI